MKDLKPYDRLQESRVPWLGRVPEHWGLVRGKDLFAKMDRPVLPGYEVVTCFRDGTVTLRKNRRLRGYTEALQESGYQGVARGDLVIHQMDGFAGAIGVSDADGKCTPVYSVCRPNPGVEPRYFAQQLRLMARSGWITALAKGIRERSTDFRYDTFAVQTLAVPPPDEQAAIVRYLDHVDRQIGSLVRAKQHLVRLLEEQTRGMVHAVVTRGSRAHARLRTLHSIPYFSVNGEWPVLRLGSVSRLRAEKNHPELPLLSVFLGRGVIPYGDGGGQVHKPSLDLAGYQRVRPGDLVLNNQQAWRGSVGVSRHHGIISPAYVVLELSPVFDSAYADFLFQSNLMVSQFLTSSKGVGDIQRDVHLPWLKNTRVPVPTLDEQKRIAEMLGEWTRDAARRAAEIQREVDLYRELRTRLVADVVTGKVDVREAAAHLPDLPTEAADLDLELQQTGDDTLAEDPVDPEASSDE